MIWFGDLLMSISNEYLKRQGRAQEASAHWEQELPMIKKVSDEIVDEIIHGEYVK